MKRNFLAALLLGAGLAGGAFAQAPAADGQDQKRRLIEQKIKLVDMLVNSPAAKSAPYGRDAESGTLVDKSRAAVDAARKALAENRYDDATRLLDEALKASSAASRKLSAEGSTLSDSALRKSYSDLGEQVATYRASLVELSRDGKSAAPARALLIRVDALSAEAAKLAGASQFVEANKKLAAAYKLAVEEIATLRAGQEVVLSLKFDTPADEFAYEQKRFDSNVVMVDLMIGEGRAEGGKRPLVDGFLSEGNRLKAQADSVARAGQYKEAVALMEKASGQLNRALQSMGIPVF